MEKFELYGLDINKVSIKDLLFNKMMFLAYILLAIGLYGVVEMVHERYFMLAANAFDAGMNPGSREVAEAMKEAIFGHGSEVKRESPWTLYIANYMFMIYSGSGIIFLVALAELLNVKIIKKTAAGFMTIGLSIVFAGLFTIVMDLNVLNMHWMFLSPNFGAGMWLMVPLYSIYIPFVLFEIYLLLTKNQEWAKKIAVVVLLLSIVVDVVEYYIQAKLFDMNTARHLWTTYPNLTLYFIVSAFVASCGIMILYAAIEYKSKLKDEFETLMFFLKKITIVCIILLAAYEATAFLFIDKDWASAILFGDFKYDFYVYIIFAIGLPFALLAYKLLKGEVHYMMTVIAAVSIIIGTYIGRLIFVYGGNAYPMSDRFGTGFEKYSEYDAIKNTIFDAPTPVEICIVIGSVGVILLVYKIFDLYLSVSSISDH